MLKSIPLAAFVFLAIVPSAQAQYGAYYAPRGPYFGVGVGPYFGYFPGQINGFWTNGYSLYGPPVPTYGSVPGVFGGSDQRLDLFPERWPIYYSPYGFGYGYRGVVIPLNQPTAKRPGPLPALAVIAPAEIEVRLPVADAVLTFQGQPTHQTGTHRFFTTPPLAGPGRYEIRATWLEDGREREEARSVVVEPGGRVVIDVSRDESAGSK